MLSHSIEIQVRYAETDQMGVAYHGDYFPWFEAARVALLEQTGIPYRALEAMNLFLPVLEGHAFYHRPAHFDDRLAVRAIISEMPGVRIRIQYEITRQGEKLATGSTVHAFVNGEGRVVRPPEAFIHAVHPFFE